MLEAFSRFYLLKMPKKKKKLSHLIMVEYNTLAVVENLNSILKCVGLSIQLFYVEAIQLTYYILLKCFPSMLQVPCKQNYLYRLSKQLISAPTTCTGAFTSRFTEIPRSFWIYASKALENKACINSLTIPYNSCVCMRSHRWRAVLIQSVVMS